MITTTSRSLRARGLKHKKSRIFDVLIKSRSLRARGLKQKLNDGQSLASMVALFTGAWIET